MKNRIIYQVDSLYREPMQIVGYEFGEGEEALCIVGSMRGNEVQQLYICSRLIRQLKEMEQKEEEFNEGKDGTRIIRQYRYLKN